MQLFSRGVKAAKSSVTSSVNSKYKQTLSYKGQYREYDDQLLKVHWHLEKGL